MLDTERLGLREFERSDTAALWAIMRDRFTTECLGCNPFTRQDAREWIAQFAENKEANPRQYYDFAIVHAGENRLIGWCNLRIHRPEHKRAELGYVIDRRFRRQGYGSEAALALVLYGFRSLGLHKIYALTDCANAASCRVLEKIGMAQEARLREEGWDERLGWRDVYRYAILCHEMPKQA